MDVAVVIPVYNGERYVAEAIDSALEQPEVRQVIVVDDGSTDGSLKACRTCARRDARVQVMRHPGDKNLGASASRNLGIAAVRCEWTAFLDADDYYLPGRFRAARTVIANEPSVDGVYDAIGVVYADEAAARWYCEKGEPDSIMLSRRVEPDRLFEALVAGDGSYFGMDGVVLRTCLFDRIGGFDTRLPMGEDTALWVRAAAVGRLLPGSIRVPVAIRRVHGDNTIYRRRGEAGVHAVRMAETLLEWARREGVCRSRRILLLDWLLNFRMDEIPPSLPYFVRKLRELAFFSVFALEHPLALQSRHFWSVAGASVGWKRWRRWMCFGQRGKPIEGEAA